ncbi:UDP-N-acetylmuramate dehydrogenase [bacterium]|nr:UDP-N-acetylmuramate dehydrogenase [bacterium]
MSESRDISLAGLTGVKGLSLREGYPLKRLTTIGAGGAARWFAQVESLSALRNLLLALGAAPWFILGGGSNLLVSDRDFPGVIVRLGGGFRRLALSGERLVCGAAAPLARLVRLAVQGGFPGFEELSGVPGSVGGAAAMNAGTHVKELGDLVESLYLMNGRGELKKYPAAALSRGYRRSLAPEAGVITRLDFRRGPGGDPASQAIRATELSSQRKQKHPWNSRTFGSTFKNPEGMIAAKLIDAAGLKGTQIGGARVSPKHANFIENDRGAAALDILALIKLVRDTVRSQSGITLEPEVRLLGFTAEELGDLTPYAVSIVKN